jgi:hypothetical protein
LLDPEIRIRQFGALPLVVFKNGLLGVDQIPGLGWVRLR